ncbi:MAG: SAM-dependent methyltransferase [Gemmatimonadetes bacterium]|nr:SAM-dependent methyltransferase [Gemmatimonadota bacterium]
MNSESTFVSWEAAVESLRNDPERQQLVRFSYYDDPVHVAAERYQASEEWQAVRTWLRGRSGTSLDVGAGRGIASYAMAREGFRVTALEPDPSDVVGAGAIRALANETGVALEVVEEFSERLPFADATFDILFARAVLHHTTDLQAACREFFRVLKPGGRLIAVREHVISRREDLPAFLSAHSLHALYGGENALLLHEYTGALDSAGFTLTSTLRPLASPINYFPQTKDSLREEVIARLGKVPGCAILLRSLFAMPMVFSLALRVLSLVDRRPGRLYSFIADRPVA